MKLLDYSTSAGCALKMSPIELNALIKQNNNEDAFISNIEGVNIVQSVDILAPIVNDPYAYGKIAVANSLSDLYAKGAVPFSAMNIACFPEITKDNKETFQAIIEGGREKLESVHVQLAGGHTVTDNNIKFGYAVSGIAKKYSLNTNLKEGDLLLLSKPIGIGLLVSALKLHLFSEEIEEIIIRNSSKLNSFGIELIQKYDIKACTDVTGFGLGGHLINMLQVSNLSASISYIPILDYVQKCLDEYIQPLRTYQNILYYSKFCQGDSTLLPLLFDPQTSGGLLFGLSETKYHQMKNFLEDNECHIIGIVKEKSDYSLYF